MRYESSPIPGNKREDLELRLFLIRAADSGALESLECPGCGNSTVSVWFTHPRENEYRTWFVCSACQFTMRTHDLTRPRHFSEGRLSHALNERDKGILERAIFKSPK